MLILVFFLFFFFQLANARAGQATSFGAVTSLLLQVASAKRFRNVGDTRGSFQDVVEETANDVMVTL